jgi:DNA polymerase-1
MKLLGAPVIRRCFIADPDMHILSADFDQIELRVAAGLAGETVLIEAAKRGESLHKTAAVRLFGLNHTADQYRYTKNVNFGWLFGGGPKTLSDQAGIPFGQAQEIIREYEMAFPALAAYKRREQEAVLRSALSTLEYKTYKTLRSRMFNYRGDTKEGKAARAVINAEIKRLCWRKIGYAETPFGRRLPVDADKAYAVVNYKVQSSARDIMGHGLLRVMADPELEPTVLLPIHDELLGQAEISKAEYIAQRYGEVMSTTFQGVPITATGKVYGKSWGHGYVRESVSA